MWGAAGPASAVHSSRAKRLASCRDVRRVCGRGSGKWGGRETHDHSLSESVGHSSLDATTGASQPVPATTGGDTAAISERGDAADASSHNPDWEYGPGDARQRSTVFDPRHAPPLVKAFLIGGVAIVGVAFVSFLIDADVEILKVGEESNLPTWYSASQLFTIGLILSAIAFRDTEGRGLRSRALVAVPGLFFFLSLDEIAMIHERLGAWLQTFGIGTDMRTAPWMFIYLPLIAVLGGIALWSFWPYLRGRRDVLVLGFLGVALFGFSAVGLESVSNFTPDGGYQQKGLGFAEEYGEMLAGSLLLWSAVLVTRAEGIRIQLGRRRGASPDPLQTSGQQPQRVTTRRN